MIENLTLSDFTVGDTFKLYYDMEHSINLTLVKANVTKYNYPNNLREPFILVFKGAKEICLSQQSYKMEHETLGTLEIVLTLTFPEAGDQQFNYYQTLFC
jgi:hypothetical protein